MGFRTVLFLAVLSLHSVSTSCAVLKKSRKHASDEYAYVAFVNDVHNRLEEEDPSTSTPCSSSSQQRGICVGGWPRISSAVKSLRLQAEKEGAAFFFLHAGDEFTGTMWDAVYQGQTVAPLLMNKVKPDVMVRGRASLAAVDANSVHRSVCAHTGATAHA